MCVFLLFLELYLSMFHLETVQWSIEQTSLRILIQFGMWAYSVISREYFIHILIIQKFVVYFSRQNKKLLFPTKTI